MSFGVVTGQPVASPAHIPLTDKMNFALGCTVPRVDLYSVLHSLETANFRGRSCGSERLRRPSVGDLEVYVVQWVGQLCPSGSCGGRDSFMAA